MVTMGQLMGRLILSFSLVLLLRMSDAGLRMSDDGLWDEQSPILRPGSGQVSNLQSPVPNLQSPVPNPQSPIPNPQSARGRLVYEEDFSDPTSGWPASDEHDIAYAYTDGEYQIFVRQSSDWASAEVDMQLTDYIVEADARCVTNCGNYGLAFGLNVDWSEFYALSINDRGEYTIWKYQDGGLKSLIGWRSSRYIESGDALNHLQVIRDGANINVVVNGQALTTVRDSAYIGRRRAGLFVYSGDERPADVRFDNFRLYTLVEGTDYIKHKMIWASSAESDFEAPLAVDGDADTRWASTSRSEFQLLLVDAGAEDYVFDQAFVDWAEAEARQWGLLVWDGATWEWVARTPATLKGGIRTLEFEPRTGRLWALVMWEWNDTLASYSLWEWGLLGASGQNPNLALRKLVTVSSVADGSSAEYAVDGELDTQWSSEASDSQWLLLDLGQTLPFNRITINWGESYGKEYGILLGQDDSWQLLEWTSGGQGEVETFDFDRTTGQRLFIYGRKPATDSGYAIREIDVWDTVGGGCLDSGATGMAQPEAGGGVPIFPAAPSFWLFEKSGAKQLPPLPDPSVLGQ